MSVTVAAGCAWQAVAGGFVTIAAGANGVGSGAVTYSVAANTTSETRTELINIAGQSFTITQAAASASNCSATLAPTNASLGPGAATGSLAVTIPAGCAWTATSNASYITITSGTSGVGSGTVSYSVAANTTGSSRSGTVTIAQQTFTVSQTGVSCGATVVPTSATVAEAGGSGSVAVTIPAGCSWTATSESSWVTITGGASGVGPGTVTYSVAANSTGGPRNGSLSIAQQRFTLTQSGPPCSNSSLSPPTGASFTGAGGTGTVMVTIPAGCSWQAFAGNFVTITSGANGVGPGTVTYSVLPNTTGASRNHSITIAGNPFMISQSTDGAPNCGATLAPTSATVAEAGGSGSVAVTIPAGCSWTATSESSWITITGGASGVGPGTVTYSVPANPTGSPRNGSLSIAQQRFTLTQSGPPCSNSSLSPPIGANFTGAGGTGTVTVTIPAGCGWQAFGGNFVTITSGANSVGPGTVTYSVLPNTTGAARNHSITIAGHSFMVSQAAN